MNEQQSCPQRQTGSEPRTDVDDLIMNTAGGLIGWGLFAGANRLWKGRRWWQNALGQPLQ